MVYTKWSPRILSQLTTYRDTTGGITELSRPGFSIKT